METSQSSNNINKMPWPAYPEVFELQQKFLKNEKNWAFLCKIGRKIIHASKTSTSKFKKTYKSVTHKALDKAILRFVIEDIQPLSIVDQHSLIYLELDFLHIFV